MSPISGTSSAFSRDYVDPPESLAYHNGKPAIVLSIAMQDGENVLKVGPRLIERSEQLEESLPWGYELDFATYQATYVAESINSVTNNVYQTLGIVLVMVMLFLGWRTGLIVGSIVPLTMLVSIVFMRLLDIEFERVSLATMIIALGLLVDNGVVIAEDIGRRLAEGAKRMEAAIATGKQLAMPLLSSSFTTILAFMPLDAEQELGGRISELDDAGDRDCADEFLGARDVRHPASLLLVHGQAEEDAGGGEGGFRQSLLHLLQGPARPWS